MKHPALARVFAVVVAILSLLLLVSGVRGFGKAASEHEDRLAYEKKFTDRIENYRSLRAELSNSADYKETMEALDRFLTEHEKAAAKHKTDTALFSATRGGLRMGESMIVSTRAQMEELKQQLRDTDARRGFLEGLLAGLISSQRSKLPWLDALTNQAAQNAVESYTESAKISLASGKLRALMENEPKPEDFISAYSAPPEPPAAPVMPLLPDMSGMSFEMMQGAYQAAADQYMSQAAAYGQASSDYAAGLQAYYDAQGQALMDRLNGAEARLMDAAAEAQYALAHKMWEEECRSVKAELDLRASRAQIGRLSAALHNLVRQANSLSPALVQELGGVYPAMGELMTLADSVSARLDRIGDSDLSALSNAEFLELADSVQELLDLMTDAFIAVGQNLDNPAPLIAEVLDRLHITEELAKMLEQMLEKADQQMQTALEELWYQMGEAEKDTVKLEAEKLGLDKEAVLLSKRTLEADALKDLRARHASARQLLLNVPEVKEGAAGDDDLADSARRWLKTYAAETARLHDGKKLINILAVVGGAMGVLGIPAAYELIRKRFLLIAPVLLCLGCAAAAELLNMALGLGQHYVALFTAIIAFFHLLIVLPRSKKARRAPQHLKG